MQRFLIVIKCFRRKQYLRKKFKNLSEHSYYCFKKNIKRNKQSIFLQLNKNF